MPFSLLFQTVLHKEDTFCHIYLATQAMNHKAN